MSSNKVPPPPPKEGAENAKEGMQHEGANAGVQPHDPSASNHGLVGGKRHRKSMHKSKKSRKPARKSGRKASRKSARKSKKAHRKRR